MKKKETKSTEIQIERVQTGVRLEKRILKVLKAIAEMADVSVGELLEIMALHAFEGEPAFSNETRAKIQKLKEIYGMDFDAHAYKKFRDPQMQGGR